ncbi:hypothetical protein VitviT2T_005568 [Vitis vinifera]|uniref:AAA-type ATPase N-terminal domain-containing protein n=1 Tax=Vitis vinifera TaxID=29760 RepID=A0ABY9BU69_VITVI|nr:hypothetical protein VitviT2T_005568 [Vitis vinifera]
MHTYVNAQGSSKNIWESVILRHPSTFETLTMDIEQKKAIIDDLDRVNLLKRKRTKAAEIKDRDEDADQLRLVTLLRTLAEETIPDRLRSYIVSSLKRFFLPPSSQLTLIIDQFCGPTSNEIYQASHIYLPTKISPSHDRIQVSKPSKQSNSTITLPKGAQVEDSFRNIRLQWKLVDDRKLFFELSFDKQFIEIVLESYLPYVIAMSKDVKEEDEEVRIYTRKYATHKTVSWDSIQLHHPAKFESFAMDPDQKKEIMEDLERFT